MKGWTGKRKETARQGAKKQYGPQDHTFVLCAYGESPYLEECVRSLLRQSVRGRVIIATSTPGRGIDEIARKYRLPMYVRRTGEKGIAADWNWGIACAATPLVTLAHQDDVYGRRYVQQVLAAINRHAHPLIAFTGYAEIREENTVCANRLLRIKRLMLLPLLAPGMGKSRFWRRRILSFGNPICCPSVTYVKEHLKLPVFENNMRSNIDWQAWEEISRQQGEFVYLPRPLMKHRIHGGSTTSRLLEEDGRSGEDLEVLMRFWPAWFARWLEVFYKTSEDSNNQ